MYLLKRTHKMALITKSCSVENFFDTQLVNKPARSAMRECGSDFDSFCVFAQDIDKRRQPKEVLVY